MYEDVGSKIQTMAKVIGWLCLIAGVLGCWYFLTDGAESYVYGEGMKFVYNKTNDIFGWMSLVFGGLGFCSSWILCGFGELIESTDDVRLRLIDIEATLKKNQSNCHTSDTQPQKRNLPSDSAPHMME